MLHAVHGEVHAGVERSVPELRQQAAEGEGEYGDCGAQRRRGIVFVGGRMDGSREGEGDGDGGGQATVI